MQIIHSNRIQYAGNEQARHALRPLSQKPFSIKKKILDENCR